MRPADATRMYHPFRVTSEYTPSGDQPAAIRELGEAVERGEPHVVLRGATGTGKSATTAWLIERLQRPTLVIAPNKTLAAQLTAELRELLGENAVEYFVSYYDYYQPEAYVPQSDTYIEKDSAINAEIERLRYSATHSLMTRRDVVVVATVSCIYGLGAPETYLAQGRTLSVGMQLERDELLRALVNMQYARNDTAPTRGQFRVRGDTVEIIPAHEVFPVRIEFFGDEVESIKVLHPVTAEILRSDPETMILPASFYATDNENLERACLAIEAELATRVTELEKGGKLLEAQRLRMRTEADLEAIRTTGFCTGIENYSRHLDGRAPGTPPSCLLDYFPEDFLTVIDESHIAVSQIGAMFEGDRSRKNTLVEYGFRLPSAMDNRPLRFEEFRERVGQVVYLSATPGKYETEHAASVVDQIIRPTGLIDPTVEIRPREGQIDDLLGEIRARIERNERTLVTTLTKRMAEELTEYLTEHKIKVQYLHSDVDTVTRIEVLRDLRRGRYDAVVGINLLREGLDLPEVSLVAILDADKEGFLRSQTSLIQTIGRAARNVNGSVLMYATKTTPAMQAAIDETNRRRAVQIAYNREHGITPTPLVKTMTDISDTFDREDEAQAALPPEELIEVLSERMRAAAEELQFESAARLRDEIKELRRELRARAEIG